MSWHDNYCLMIRRNKATGFAIYHCLLQVYNQHYRKMDLLGITDRDITAISEKLLVSERWIRHVICNINLRFNSNERRVLDDHQSIIVITSY